MSAFKNRIVERGQADVAGIKAHPLNWRLHPASQRALLGDVLESVGWVSGVLINRTTGHLLDGHLRVEEARAAGEKTVPAIWVEMTEEEEKAVLAVLDPLSGYAYADMDALQALVAEAGGHAPVDLLVSGVLTELPDQAMTLGDANTVFVRVGDIRFPIAYAAYVAWRDALIQQVGMKRQNLLAEMARRLGLEIALR